MSKPRKEWNELTWEYQVVCVRKNDPRVPPDWDARPAKGANRTYHNKDWEQLSSRVKKRLWEMGDPKVPPGWNPPLPRTQDPSTWHSLSENYKVQLYRKNDPRVPPDWRPAREAGFWRRPPGSSTKRARAVNQTVTPLYPKALAVDLESLGHLLGTSTQDLLNYLRTACAEDNLYPETFIFRLGGREVARQVAFERTENTK